MWVKLNTYLIRNLAPLANYDINDAFAAAHRNAPSMVAFQELLPSAARSIIPRLFLDISELFINTFLVDKKGF